jgi:Fic family protein
MSPGKNKSPAARPHSGRLGNFLVHPLRLLPLPLVSGNSGVQTAPEEVTYVSATVEAASWPPVASEELPWTNRYEHGVASRSQIRQHQGPYRAAIPARIAKTQVTLSADTLSISTDAANEVARFDAELGGEIARFSAALLRSESAASSQIENLTASARAISEAEIGEKVGSNAQQVVGNVAAMKAALGLSDDLTAQSILDMHDALLRDVDPAIAGKWRDEQVWVGGSHLGPHKAAYVAPHQRRVPGLIDDLVGFMDRDDIPVLAQVALAHAQFETIHPFPDGNGRTGRALMHAMLRGKGLTRTVTVPISAGLLVDVEDYFAALTAYREGDAELIVRRVADASYAAVNNGRTLVSDLRAIREDWQSRIRARRGAASWKIADLLLRHPVINVRLVSDDISVLPQHVYRAVGPLVNAGVLVSSGRQRNRVWGAPEVLVAIDAFAARAGRRRLSRP